MRCRAVCTDCTFSLRAACAAKKESCASEMCSDSRWALGSAAPHTLHTGASAAAPRLATFSTAPRSSLSSASSSAADTWASEQHAYKQNTLRHSK